MPTATLTSKGQMVIPKSVREHLGLQPGDMLDFLIQEDGDVLVRPAVEDVKELKGILHRPGAKPVSLKEMKRIIRKRGGQGR